MNERELFMGIEESGNKHCHEKGVKLETLEQ